MSKGEGGGRPRGSGLPPEWIGEAVRMRDAKMSYRAIGKVIGCDQQTVRRWIDPEAKAKFSAYYNDHYYPDRAEKQSAAAVANRRARAK